MKILFLAIAFLLIGENLGAETCTIRQTKDQSIKNFEDCKSYSTSSESKVCCYVNGTDTKENAISACNELTGTVKGALKDLKELGGLSSDFRSYYLSADCNLGQTLSICDPDDRKSENPLSVKQCSKYPVVNIDGVSENSKCCYVTGISVSKKNVYSCARNDDYVYTIQEMKKQIESGKYQRLGALTNVNIVCPSPSPSPSYGNYCSISIISLVCALLNFL